jgi:hypothetical protein
MTKKALFICGSLNQTAMMHKIASCLPEFDGYFSPFYAEGGLHLLSKTGLLKYTILAGKHRHNTLQYLAKEHLPIDEGGHQHDYDLVVTCTDLIVQSNIRNKRLVLVQEGITEPEDITFPLVKYLKFPRFLANTAATGLSDAYDLFCVASDGYRDLFIHKGVKPGKIIVTGIPNFDNAQEALQNDFIYHDYVLVATSSIRESGKFDNRMGFLKKVIQISNGRQVIFKLHPNENALRAENEIRSILPSAIIFKDGNTNHMIANCAVLITQVSSVVYIGIALGKEVHSYIDLDQLYRLAPIQNNGSSASHIADVCRNLVGIPLTELRQRPVSRPLAPGWLSF